MWIFSKKTHICFIIRLLGGFGVVQNTPTGCGNNLPILLRSHIFLLKSRSVNYFFSGLFSTFSRILDPGLWILEALRESCSLIDHNMGPPRRLIGSILPTVAGKIWKLLGMPVFLKNRFCIIWLLGGFGMVQNTPTGCGNNLPVLLRSNICC